MSANILCFGSLNIDYVYALDEMVKEGETVSSLGRTVNAGGKGLNQATAFAKAGARIAFAGNIGTDGEILWNALQESGIDASFVNRTETESGHAIIQVDKKGRNCIIVHGGANKTISAAYVDRVLASFKAQADGVCYVVLQNEINNIDYIMRKAHELDIKIIFNPSPLNDDCLRYPLELVSFFCLNEHEGAVLADGATDDVLGAVCRKFPDSKVLLTLGKEGAVFWDGEKTYSYGIFDVPVVDTTAAGDTFSGYFCSAYSEGADPDTALIQATAASSICVSRHGATVSIPKKEEVLSFVAERT